MRVSASPSGTADASGLEINVNVSNTGEPAYLTNLYVQYPTGLYFQKHTGKVRTVVRMCGFQPSHRLVF